jgi:hypothetical protein
VSCSHKYYCVNNPKIDKLILSFFKTYNNPKIFQKANEKAVLIAAPIISCFGINKRFITTLILKSKYYLLRTLLN